MDIETLYEISQVLQVSVPQLTDIGRLQEEADHSSAYAARKSPFFQAKMLYFYFYDGRYNRMKDGVINIHEKEGNGSYRATLSICSVSGNGRSSESYYNGSVLYGATGLLLGIALAMYRRVDADKRAKYKSMFISTVLAVFLTGVTEPLEFMFMFCAMPLYVVYAILQGCAFAMAGIIHLRLHSFGNLEFITRIPMSLQAGLGGDIINFVICVIVFFADRKSVV